MTPLNKPVHRRTGATLDGSFGTDRHKRIIVTLIPGRNEIPDTITLRPERTRRGETIAIMDVYRYALRCRVNRVTLEKARAKKERKAVRLATRRQKAAERRLTK